MQSRCHKVLIIIKRKIVGASGVFPTEVEKAMLSRNLYQGCHYHGLRRQNICKSGEILLWKQSRSVFDEKPEALWVGDGIPGGLHMDAPGFGVEMPIFRSGTLLLC